MCDIPIATGAKNESTTLRSLAMFSNTTFSARFTRNAATALVAGTMALTASFAHASPSTADMRSVEVSYADLNLATEQGVNTLHQRIVTAARHVCPLYSSRDTSLLAKQRLCVADAVNRALNDINPKLAGVRSALAR
ncbi:MAG: UrcA family protein [Gammaproteobacteria bacterium]